MMQFRGAIDTERERERVANKGGKKRKKTNTLVILSRIKTQFHKNKFTEVAQVQIVWGPTELSECLFFFLSLKLST